MRSNFKIYFLVVIVIFLLMTWIFHTTSVNMKNTAKNHRDKGHFYKKKEKKIPEHYFPNLGPNHITILKANLIQDINRGFAFSIGVLIMELFIEGSAPLWLERKFVTLLI